MATRTTNNVFRTIGLTAVATAVGVVAAAAPAQAHAGGAARPFHAGLDGTFVVGVACPADVPTGMTCLSDHVEGSASQLGRISGDFLVVFDGTRPDADGCVPIRKTGAFRIGGGAKLNVQAQGKFCDSTGVATYTYTFTGGTCRFAHATGSGTWLVPAATTYDPATGRGTGPESLDGTIQF